MTSGQKEQCCGGRCMCCPYSDGWMIAAQVISIVAFLISWIWFVTFLIGLVCMILLQVVWCCRQGRVVMVSMALISAAAGTSSVIAGTIMGLTWKGKPRCSPYTLESDDYYFDDYWRSTNSTDQEPYFRSEGNDACPQEFLSIVAFLTGGLWYAVAICIAIFVATGRHAKWEARHGPYSNDRAISSAEVVVIEMGTDPGDMGASDVSPPVASATLLRDN